MSRNKLVIVSLLVLLSLPIVFGQSSFDVARAFEPIWAIVVYIVGDLPNGQYQVAFYKFVMWILLWALLRKLIDKLPMFKGEHH